MTIIVGGIRIKRGLKANLPVLEVGEPAYCTDTNEYFIGTEEGNKLIGGNVSAGGALVFNTLAELQSAHPGGSTQPVWVVAENSWYYWEGEITEPTPDTTAPNEVTNLSTSNVSQTSLTLSWTASTSSDIASYEVYRGTTLLTTVTGTTYNVTGLTASTAYTFTVKAKDTTGNVSTGVSTQATTIAEPIPNDTTAPNNVTNLAYSNVTSTGVTLTWTASTSTDVANYQIYKDGVNIGQASGTEFVVSGLSASTAYQFTVKAKDTSANEASGVSVNVTTSAPADTTAPILTITPAATFTDTQIVTMSANESSTIYYTLDGSAPTTASSVYSAALSLSETTTVKAFARDTAGNSSAVQTVTYTKEAVVSNAHLALNGTTGRIQAPSMTFNKVVMDFHPKQKTTAFQTYLDGRTGSLYTYIQRDNTEKDNWGTGTVKINNGAALSNGLTQSIPTNSRFIMEYSISTVGTDDITFFASKDSTFFMEALVYNIKVYNGATLVAHYDLSSGNANDISGNNYHATVVGGTWVTG